MKRLLPLFLLFSFYYSSAQNYAPFYSSSRAFFEDSYFGFIKPIEKARIDSVKILGTDSILFPFKELGTSLNTSSTINPCYNLFVSSWMGSRIVKNIDSTIVYNNLNEPIYFQQSAPVGDSIVMFRYTNGIWSGMSVEGHIIGKKLINIPGLGQDSVKELILIIKNSIGRPLSSPWDQDTLLLSKNFGLINSYRWNNFPHSFTSDLQTLIDYNYLTPGEVYDYNIGDEFHYQTTNPINTTTYLNVDILGKWYSTNLDTVYYKRNIAEEVQSTTGTSLNFYVDTIKYTDLNSPINSPMHPMAPNTISGSGFSSFTIKSYEYNNRTFEEVITNDHVVTIDSNCYSPSSSPQYNSRSFIRGAGEIVSNTDTTKLIYYKKGVELWGTPHLITSLSKIQLSNNDLTLYPNPSLGKVNLNSTSGEIISQIRVFNSLGQINQEFAPNKSRFEWELPKESGLYFIQISNMNGQTYTLKSIRK